MSPAPCPDCTPDRWCGCAQLVAQVDELDADIAEMDRLFGA